MVDEQPHPDDSPVDRLRKYLRLFLRHDDLLSNETAEPILSRLTEALDNHVAALNNTLQASGSANPPRIVDAEEGASPDPDDNLSTSSWEEISSPSTVVPSRSPSVDLPTVTNETSLAMRPAAPTIPSIEGNGIIGLEGLRINEQTGIVGPGPKMISFRIDNFRKVEHFLRSRISLMRQQAMKKLAKAWIKGICPRKQSRYPYQVNRRNSFKDQVISVPPWWPPQELCPFKEPDHIHKSQRENLILHLLRLRPTLQEVEHWNGGTLTGLPTVNGRVAWTTFLSNLAPWSVVEEALQDSPRNADRRRRLLSDFYHVAEMEEGFRCGDNDGTMMWEYVDEEPSAIPLKRKAIKTEGGMLTSLVAFPSSMPTPLSQPTENWGADNHGVDDHGGDDHGADGRPPSLPTRMKRRRTDFPSANMRTTAQGSSRVEERVIAGPSSGGTVIETRPNQGAASSSTAARPSSSATTHQDNNPPVYAGPSFTSGGVPGFRPAAEPNATGHNLENAMNIAGPSALAQYPVQQNSRPAAEFELYHSGGTHAAWHENRNQALIHEPRLITLQEIHLAYPSTEPLIAPVEMRHQYYFHTASPAALSLIHPNEHDDSPAHEAPSFPEVRPEQINVRLPHDGNVDEPRIVVYAPVQIEYYGSWTGPRFPPTPPYGPMDGIHHVPGGVAGHDSSPIDDIFDEFVQSP